MGFFIRKSFRFGPLRFNLSKSGVGLSAGVTGLRVGVKPSGQTYVAGGRGGLYFRENLNAGQPSTGVSGGPYTLTGRAIQKRDGQPAVGIPLHVFMDNRPDVRTSVVTDADGRFRATGLSDGDFTVSGDAALLQTLTVVLDPGFRTDGANGCLMGVLIVVGLAIVIVIVMALDGDFRGPGNTSPVGKMDYNARPAEVPTRFAEVPTPEPIQRVAPAVPVEDPTPTGQGTITMHGKTITVQRK